MITKQKEEIRRIFRGYDNSLRVKGITLISILDKLDSNTDIKESDIKRQLDIFFNKTALMLKNTGRKSQMDWLLSNSTSENIYRLTYTYNKLNSSVYKVDDNLISWFRSQEERSYGVLEENDLGLVLLFYKDELYTVTRFEPNTNMNCIHIEVCTINTKPVSYTFNFSVNTDENNIDVVCSNKLCPRYKQSMAQAYNDGSRIVYCSAKDCEKCGYLRKSNILAIEDVKDLITALYTCILNRNSSSVSKLEKKDYEHIPLPECQGDVIVYFGGEDKVTKFKEKFVVVESNIVGSYASPREHNRRKHTRTYKNGKTVDVKATVVNKGHTKTTYKLKERK